MAFTVTFSLRAGRQLDELYRTIELDSGTERADRFVNSIVEYCLGFDTFPERGMRRNDIWPGLRIVGFRHVASIVFRFEGDHVVIHGVYYGGQDFEANLKEDGL